MSRVRKKTRDPYVTVMWTDETADSTRRHNEASYRTSDLPTLFDRLRSRGIVTVWIDDRETSIRTDGRDVRGRARYTVVTQHSRLGRWTRSYAEASGVADLWKRNGMLNVRVVDDSGRTVYQARDRRRHRR